MTLRLHPLFPAAVFLVALFLVLPVSAGQTGNLVPADILRAEDPGHFTLSPDGMNLVYFKTLGSDLAPPQGNGTLMHISVRSGVENAITGPTESVTSYALSPDGSRVVYAAVPRAGGNTTLTVVSLSDRNKIPLKNVPADLFGNFLWLGTDRLVFTGIPDSLHKPPQTGNAIVADERPDPTILKTYSLSDGTVAPLTNNTDVITIFAPSPDGKYVFYKASVDPQSWQTPATFRYVLLDTHTGQENEILSYIEGYQDTNEFAWSPDSSTVYIERMQNGGIHYPVEYTAVLLAYSPASGTLEPVPLNWSRGLIIDLFNNDIEVNPFNGGAYVLLANGTNPQLAKYVRNDSGWHMSPVGGAHAGNIFAIETDRTGNSIVYNYNSAAIPPQLFSADVLGNAIQSPRQLTHLNEDLIAKPLGNAEVTGWQGARGDTIAGVVRYPPGYISGKKYPLVLVIHGGPNYADFDSWRDTWEFPYHLITDKGAVTLSTNYHGGTNFGFAFAQSIEGGNYYELPVEDLRTGIDHLVKMGIINRTLVGSTGWSNGGTLTLALITKDPAIRAAVSGAGTADENTQVANTNGIVMDKMYYQQTPYQDTAAFISVLPVYRAKNVTTPLLMMIGTNDNSVVPAGAWVTYRAFREGSRAPVRFVIFRDEPHHLKMYGNQLRKVQEELDWLDRYLLSFSPNA